MSGLRIVLADPPGAVDCRDLFLPGWEGLAADAMLRREVALDGRRVPLGDVATASGTANGTAVLEGAWRQASWVGAGLAAGTVVVTDGVGAWAGAGMSGGVLVIRGDAADHLGAGLPGRKRGMTGGEIVVHGSVGEGAGRAMRRGLVAVGGNAGRGAGYSILAGTIVCLGAVGADAGLLNKRGTIVAAGTIGVPPTYQYASTFRPAFLAVILRRLRHLRGLAITDDQASGAWHRWSGDLAELGKGEILTREPT